MKGLIFDIKHYALHDGPGIRQTVFFKGCPLSCWWCHNPESQWPEPELHTKSKTLEGRVFEKEEQIGYFIDSSELFRIIESDTLFYDESAGGVTFSGGEPIMQPDFLRETARRCKQAEIHTCLDTCGYADQQDLLRVMPFIDMVLFDIKIGDETLHRKYTGVSHQTILENLRMLDHSGTPTRLRFPIVPGITDTNGNLKKLQHLLSPLKNITSVDVLSYHNISRSKYERFGKEFRMGEQQPDPESYQRVTAHFRDMGFDVHTDG
jgi:pyruvate formate lyase activating enzyme